MNFKHLPLQVLEIFFFFGVCLQSCLVVYFKQQFSMFKQYYVFSHIFLPIRIFKKYKPRY